MAQHAGIDPGTVVRLAAAADWPTLVDFNCRLAWETEATRLRPEVVTPGVQALLRDSHKGRYFVAVRPDDGAIVGQLMHTREWSDWRNGDIWWLQSVYVHPEWRGRGVFRQLLAALEAAAEAEGVVGLRLYVEDHNAPAQAVYQRHGFQPGGYHVLELWQAPTRWREEPGDVAPEAAS